MIQASEYTRSDRIAAIARSWIGTPFFPHQAVKGVGTDCVQLARAVYVEAGIAPPDVVFPRYSLDGGSHLKKSAVIEFLENCPFFKCLTVDNDWKPGEVPVFQSGDLITFQIGRVPHHVGIMTSEHKFVHAIRDHGVIECDLRDTTWSSRMRSVWRAE